MADANAGWGVVALAVMIPAAIAAALPLVALGLAFFPGKRRAAVWVSAIALAAGLFCVFIFVRILGDDDVNPHWELLAMSALPAYLSLIALNLGLRGFAPPSQTSKSVLVLLLAAPVAGIAANAYYRHWLEARQAEQRILLATGPSSYQGIPLSEWVKRYVPLDPSSNPYRADREDTRAERERAADAIRHIGAEALPLLLEWLDEQKPAANLPAFGALGPAAAALAIPELTRRINSPPLPKEEEYLRHRTPYGSGWYPPRRERAMLALSYFGPDAAPAMTAVLSNPELAGLASAAQCIKNMGTNARPLLPLLVQNLQHRDPKVARSAADSLGILKIEPDLVVPALVKNLDHPDQQVRYSAIESLIAYGELACPAAVPAMIKALDDRTPAVRTLAVRALGMMKCEPDLVLAALAKSLEHPEQLMRGTAVKSLAAFGEPALPALRNALGHPDGQVRRQAQEALQKIAPKIIVEAGSYGRNCGAREGNMTAFLASACNGQGRCSYVLDDQILGDPAPGCKKDYEAQWRCGQGQPIRTAVVRVDTGPASKPSQPVLRRRTMQLGTVQLACY